MSKRRLSDLAVMIAFTLLYIGAGKLGLSLAFLNASASPVWPPTGLALAAILLFGYRLWPAVLVGAFVVNITTSHALMSSIGIAIGNTLEAVVGAMLARRFANGAASFDSARGVFRFVGLAAIPSTIISATVGVTCLAIAGAASWDNYGPIWLTWWTGDLVSDLIVAPLLLLWGSRPLPRISVRAAFEAALLIALLLVVSISRYGQPEATAGKLRAMSYLNIPILMWAAFRFRQRGAVTAAFLMSCIAIWGTQRGYGPFASNTPENDALVLLQAFLGFNTLTMLVLAAVVSERQRVLASLGQNEQRLRMAMEAGKMGTWEWDIASGAVHWSPGLERIHGLEPGTFPGKFEAFLADVHPEDRQMVQQRIAAALEGRIDHHIEYRLLLADGTMRWVEARGRLICDSQNRPQRMIGICMDISERKQSQEEIEQLLQRERAARQEAERANGAKDGFLAVLSHELRTPLTPVLLAASMLENDVELPSHVRSNLQMIRRNVEMESRLIDDLLDLTRISRGKLKLHRRVTDVHAVIHRALEICAGDGKSIAEIKLELHATRHHVMADEGRLQQVFWNLLSNARKFTPAGGTIIVRSRNTEDAITIEVADTGVGIEPDVLPRLFTAFEQGDSPHARRAGGLGLGLAICKALIDAHQGMLTVQSQGRGCGATFSVRMPVAVEKAVDTARNNGDGAGDTPRRSLRILLVEDHESTLLAMKTLLEMRNHTVTAAMSVASALEASRNETFDLVISDLGLPDGEGHDIMRALTARQKVTGIALSGYGMAEDLRQSKEAGFTEHLVKPVDFDALEAAIQRATVPRAG